MEIMFDTEIYHHMYANIYVYLHIHVCVCVDKCLWFVYMHILCTCTCNEKFAFGQASKLNVQALCATP